MEKSKFYITIYSDDPHYIHFKKRFEERVGTSINFNEYMNYQNLWDKSVPFSKKGSKAFTLRLKEKSTTTVQKANLIFNNKKRLVTIIPIKWNETLIQNNYKNKQIAKDLLK